MFTSFPLSINMCAEVTITAFDAVVQRLPGRWHCNGLIKLLVGYSQQVLICELFISQIAKDRKY